MNKDAQDIIKKQLEIIPPRVREALLHIDSSKYIQALAVKHHLRIDQGGVLEEEAMLIMLGLESPSMFMNNLIRQGHIPPSVAAAIVGDINKDVFEKIRHDLTGFLEQSQERFARGETNPTPAQTTDTVLPQKQSPQPTASAPQTPAVQKNSTPVPNAGFAKEKMEGAFRMPAETTRVGEAPAPARPAQPPYTGVDPYREPTK